MAWRCAGKRLAHQRAGPAGTRPALKLAEGYPDGLSRGQRRVMIGAVVAAHVALGWGLLQIREVREAVAEAAPMFVSLIAPPAPPKPCRRAAASAAAATGREAAASAGAAA